MSKKMCEDFRVLELKMQDKKPKYYCKKCDSYSTKEKWICKPKTLK
jgi:hypothetical protein